MPRTYVPRRRNAERNGQCTSPGATGAGRLRWSNCWWSWGSIALLLAILLPSLRKAREAADRTKCLSNLRQVGFVMQMYRNENRNRFFPAGNYGF